MNLDKRSAAPIGTGMASVLALPGCGGSGDDGSGGDDGAPTGQVVYGESTGALRAMTDLCVRRAVRPVLLVQRALEAQRSSSGSG